MIVAIAEAGSGVAGVKSFVEAGTVEQGVLDHCNAFDPPKIPTDYVGVDTGWEGAVPQPPDGLPWGVDRTALTVVGTAGLADAKVARMNAIDAKTGALIGAGFTYDGKLFSESSAMQRNLLVLNARDLRGILAGLLPMVISTQDNMDEVSIATTTEFVAFYNAAELQALTAYGGGNAIKSQVRAITNDVGQADVAPNYHDLAAAISAVEAVADTR